MKNKLNIILKDLIQIKEVYKINNDYNILQLDKDSILLYIIKDKDIFEIYNKIINDKKLLDSNLGIDTKFSKFYYMSRILTMCEIFYNTKNSSISISFGVDNTELINHLVGLYVYGTEEIYHVYRSLESHLKTLSTKITKELNKGIL